MVPPAPALQLTGAVPGQHVHHTAVEAVRQGDPGAMGLPSSLLALRRQMRPTPSLTYPLMAHSKLGGPLVAGIFLPALPAAVASWCWSVTPG